MRWLALPGLLTACTGDKDETHEDDPAHDETDTDTDSDADSDTDADTDTDSDTDSDSDSDTDTDADTDTGTDTGAAWVGSAVTVDNGDGTFTTEVDATSNEGWTYFDLGTASVVPPPADPATSGDWDLAFRRDAIAVDGGISGVAGVGAVPLPHVPFEALVWPSVAPLWVDLPDANGDGVPEYAFASWYDYDYVTHQLSPADRTWSVRDRDGQVWRLRFDSYYNAYDVSGHPTFTWGPLTEPGPLSVVHELDGTVTATISATSETDPVYLRLAPELALLPPAPLPSDAWDLAIARTVVAVGGGASGAGGVEVAVLPATDFASVTAAPTDGWLTDEDTDGDGVADVLAMGTWYDYDYVTHVVTPLDQVYVLRTSDGLAFKFQFQVYDDGTHTVRWGSVAP